MRGFLESFLERQLGFGIGCGIERLAAVLMKGRTRTTSSTLALTAEAEAEACLRSLGRWLGMPAVAAAHLSTSAYQLFSPPRVLLLVDTTSHHHHHHHHHHHPSTARPSSHKEKASHTTQHNKHPSIDFLSPAFNSHAQPPFKLSYTLPSCGLCNLHRPRQ